MGRRASWLLFAASLLAPYSAAFADHVDGMTLMVTTGAASGSLDLDWTGGQPTFRVYRSRQKSLIVDPSTLIGTTDVRTFSDTPPVGAAFFYEIASPCVYNPPEVCNGVDDDCDGTVDGPGSETSCHLANASAACVAGACAVAACNGGWGDCDGSAPDGCEAPLDVAQSNSPAALWAGDPDPNQDLKPGFARVPQISNCGACGVTCDDGIPCTTDLCVPVAGSSAVASCRHYDRGQCSEARCGGVTLPPGIPAPRDPACTAPDTDGDGLSDSWETPQTNPYTGTIEAVGVDLDCDGEIGASDNDLIWHEEPSGPATPDIYLQYDYMAASVVPGEEETESHAPLPPAIDAVAASFARHGVTLHVDPVHHVLPHFQVVYFPSMPSDPCAAGDAVSFYSLKDANFDPRRRIGYHYFVFGHDSCYGGATTSGTSGIAEVLGNDAMVTLGGFPYDGTATQIVEKKKREQAGTFLHELGHNLKLHHGGSEEGCVPSPCPGIDAIQKPNYFSSMNHMYQLGGIETSATPGTTFPLDPLAPWRVDYSSDTLFTLTESSLDENMGLTGALPPHDRDVAKYFCLGEDPYLAPAIGPIDWNCDGTINPAVASDVNGDGGLTPLTGSDDWDHLDYKFQCSSTYADGVPAPGAVATGELTIAQAMAEHLRADVCPSNINYNGTGSLGECNYLNDSYVSVLGQASACDTSSPVAQCTQIVDNSLICPCPTESNPANVCAFETMARLRRQWELWRCDLWYSCPENQCPQPTGAVCQGTPGSCRNLF